MKRTVPLIITGVVGLIFIVAFFTPAAEFLSQLAAVWFDILAGIAFILGGGNLLKMHLQKVSDRRAGWGYSAVTLVAFLITLFVGLVKWGSPPAVNQEFSGQTFALLSLSAFPESQVTRIDGTIPRKENGQQLPPSVRTQIAEENGQITFRGWMLPNQEKDLEGYKDLRRWRTTLKELAQKAQPPDRLKGRASYYAEHSALSFKGYMDDADRDALSGLGHSAEWKRAVEDLYQRSRIPTCVSVDTVPKDFRIPESLKRVVTYDTAARALEIKGPMSTAQRDTLADQFPSTAPLTASERQQLREKVESHGQPLSVTQAATFESVLDDATGTEQTLGERNKLLGLALLKQGPLSAEQRDFLFADYREQFAWRAKVGELFVAAHVTKYPWSGEYRSQGNPFWWLYEYAFKPLTATMFAILAFYVASAAFRAFRAKNIEAILLLVTAFIILLGRTSAAGLLTDWLPDALSGLKVSNLTVYIMQVFNTAGNRAIMIGIALGIVSMSLKVLLGVDRSYLGSGED